MSLPILGLLALGALVFMLLIGRSARRGSAPISQAELIKRVKRLP